MLYGGLTSNNILHSALLFNNKLYALGHPSVHLNSLSELLQGGKSSLENCQVLQVKVSLFYLFLALLIPILHLCILQAYVFFS